MATQARATSKGAYRPGSASVDPCCATLGKSRVIAARRYSFCYHYKYLMNERRRNYNHPPAALTSNTNHPLMLVNTTKFHIQKLEADMHL